MGSNCEGKGKREGALHMFDGSLWMRKHDTGPLNAQDPRSRDKWECITTRLPHTLILSLLFRLFPFCICVGLS